MYEQVFNTNTQLDTSKETKLVNKVNLKWVPNNGFSFDKLEVGNNGAVVVESSLADLVPGLKLEFKGNDSNKGDFGAIYTHKLATIASEVDLLQFSKASASIVGGNGPVSVGASADFNISKSALSAFSATLGYNFPSIAKVFLKSTKFFTEHTALVTYSPRKDVTLAGQAVYNDKLQFLLAGAYKCNPETTLKLKASSAAGFSASVKQAFDKKLTVVGAAEVAKSLDSVKFGITASLG